MENKSQKQMRNQLKKKPLISYINGYIINKLYKYVIFIYKLDKYIIIFIL